MNLSHAAARAMLCAMVLSMTSDGHVADEEIATLHERWARVSSIPIDPNVLAADIERATRTPDAMWLWLKQQAASLSPAEREQVLRGAVWVVIADGDFADAEMITLRRVARALDVTAELRRVMNQVWHEAQGR